ncbi:MAG: hypothetical protein ACRD4E_02005, partial [Bryobacteraceae bacterium]
MNQNVFAFKIPFFGDKRGAFSGRPQEPKRDILSILGYGHLPGPIRMTPAFEDTRLEAIRTKVAAGERLSYQ